MMTISRFKNLLAALILAFTMSVAFTACSSSEEAPPPADSGGGGGGGEECPGGGPRGAEGRCCDVDPGQEGCFS